MIKKTLKIVDTINEWAGRIVSVFLLIIIAIVAYEVVMRYVFNAPTIWVNEMTSFIFGGYIALTGGYVMLHGEHVRMDVFYNKLSTRKKALMDIITFIFVALVCFAYIWKGGSRALFAIRNHETKYSLWAPPVAYVKSCLPIGGVLLAIQAVAKLIRDIFVLAGKEESQNVT